jgi:4-hydroxy-3-polyprenylbenzoate decarboxylase
LATPGGRNVSRGRLPRLASVKPPLDLREWIALLEREGELTRVAAEVDPELEITEIADRAVRAGGPALLFEHPKGSQLPLLINQFGTERRICLALGVEQLDDAAGKLASLLELELPRGARAKVRKALELKSLATNAQPRRVRRGACQEIVLTDDEIDLGLLPVQRCWPDDPAPFITLPAVITLDPETKARNVGMYRMQVIDRRTTFLHWQVHKDAAASWREMEDRLEVAVAIGLDPITTYAATAPLPRGIDELMLAGVLRGRPVELVPAKTVQLDVPAQAEIVLEGYVERGEVGMEGPFGDHTGFYSPAGPFPLFHLTAMTMREGAIYPSIVVGKPPAEDAWLGKVTERLFLPVVRSAVPEIVDFDLPVAGAFHNCVIVSIRKDFPNQARKVASAIWGLGMLSLTKAVVVVDEQVNPHDYEDVFFHVCANVDPKRDVWIGEGPLDQLDHSASRESFGGKIGIDATRKSAEEGAREWPQEIEMSADIKQLVEWRWHEYGIDL